MVLVIVAMDGDTAVVGDGPWHGCHSCDDASRRVIAQDGVCCFPIFPSATKDEDLAIAHRHATALLQERGGQKFAFTASEYTNAKFLQLQLQSFSASYQLCLL